MTLSVVLSSLLLLLTCSFDASTVDVDVIGCSIVCCMVADNNGDVNIDTLLLACNSDDNVSSLEDRRSLIINDESMINQ